MKLLKTLASVGLLSVIASCIGIDSKPAFAGCNPFGCSQSSVAECNPFGCPNAPMGEACNPFGCPNSPQSNNYNNSQNSSNGNSTSNVRSICNSVGKVINVSLGYESGVSKGLWVLQNGECLNLANDPVHGKPEYYFAYSFSRGQNTGRWMGDKIRQFCIDSQRFEIDSRGGCINGAVLRPFGSIGRGGVNLTP